LQWQIRRVALARPPRLSTWLLHWRQAVGGACWSIWIPQGNASTGLGLKQAQRVHSSYDLLLGDASLKDAAIPTLIPNLDMVPATVDLSGAEIELVEYEDRTGRLKAAFDKSDANWDICIIDCPPSLGLITINALVAVDSLLVPLQCEFLRWKV
jgi:chromosome partitioning protein